MKRLNILLAALLTLCTPVPVWAQTPPDVVEPVLPLSAAVARAYGHNPGLRRLRREYAQATARLQQAGLLSNPELQFVGEDVAGSAAFTPDRFTQFTLEVAQALPLGDRLGREKEIGRLNQELLMWEYRLQLLRVARDVSLEYARIQYLAARLALLREILLNAQATQQLIQKRVDAGKQPPVAVLLAQQQVQELLAEQTGETSQERLARLELAALWGDSDPDMSPVDAALPIPVSLVEAKVFRQRLPQHPQIARWGTETTYREQSVLAAQAQGLPDLTLGGGLRYHPALDWSLVVNVGMPLPVFNRNQGNVEEARLRQASLEREREQDLQQLNNELSQAYESYQGAFGQWEQYREQVALAGQAFRIELIMFNEGKTDYLPLLRSQDSIFRAQHNLLEAQWAATQAAITLRYLTHDLEPVKEVPITPSE